MTYSRKQFRADLAELGITPEQFASMFAYDVRTTANWGAGRHPPAFPRWVPALLGAWTKMHRHNIPIDAR